MEKTKKRPYLAYVILVLILALLIFLPKLAGRVSLYDDEQTIGNTSGNLLNGGLFCEDAADEKIYFSNPDDHGTLYSMDMNLSDITKIYDDNASYINSAGKYMFYTRRNDKKGAAGNIFLSFSNVGLYRIKKSSGKLGQLYNEPTQAATLFGNYVYYQHYTEGKGLDLYRSKIDGKEDTLLTEDGVNPSCIVDGNIYCAGQDEDHYIYSINKNGAKTTIYEGNCTNVLYHNNKLYYMDMDHDYNLACINLDGTKPTLLTDKRICTYNFSYDGNSIYYQVDAGDDSNGLYELNLSSMESKKLAPGDFNYIHVTSKYVFFGTYDLSSFYVFTPGGEIKNFTPGKES